MNDTHAQTGIFAEPFNSAHYLEYQLIESNIADIKTAIKKALEHNATCYANVAFGLNAWQLLNPQWTPEELQSFTTLKGKNGYSMPSTQADILFWIHGTDQGEVMNAVIHINQSMNTIATLTSDVSGFKNKESRDLTGFVDGTENPKDQARFDAALIAKDKLGAGGSYVLTQQWQHNLTDFNQLPIVDQEQIIGRTKADDIELEGDDNPPTSHVSRTDAKIDGIAAKIFRRSTPYANATEQGLYFIALSCEIKRFNVQLERMLGNTDDGCSDKLMKYSTAETGAYWFMTSKKGFELVLFGA